jgi:1,4-alpha-glucan branching enzyme
MEDPGKKGEFLAPREKDVEFTFRSPHAKKVSSPGEFDYWEAPSLPMEKNRKEFGKRGYISHRIGRRLETMDENGSKRGRP